MTGKRRKGKDPIRPPEPPAPPEQPASKPPEIPTVVAPRLTRRQARQQRKRQQRRRVGLLGGSVIAVVAIIVIGLAAFGVHHIVTRNNGSTRSQATVLFQLQDSAGNAPASALLAESASNGNGVEVLVPSRVLTEVCGYNTVDFGDVLGLPGGQTESRQAISGLLGNITVDGSWVLQEAQLSKLVTLLHGITVDRVDVDVVRHNPGGGTQILVPAGSNRRLTGAQAVEYATYIASPTEDASNQLARLQQVIDATVQALPRSQTGVEALLRQLGPGGGSTIGVTRLADLLVSFAASERATGRLLPIDLPVNAIDAGGSQPSYRVDTAGAQRLVHNSLADSIPTGAGTTQPTVELLNGVGTPGLVATTCPRLAANHFAYAGSTNAANFPVRTSTVVVSTSNLDIGYRVASALRLPRSDVRRASQDQSVATVVVTLGQDYRP